MGKSNKVCFERTPSMVFALERKTVGKVKQVSAVRHKE